MAIGLKPAQIFADALGRKSNEITGIAKIGIPAIIFISHKHCLHCDNRHLFRLPAISASRNAGCGVELPQVRLGQWQEV